MMRAVNFSQYLVNDGRATQMTLILSNDDADKLLTMPECIAVLEEAYAELAEGRGVSRTRSDCFAPTAREDALYSLKSMDGVVPKFGVGAVRINSDIVTWPKRGNNVRREKIPAAPGNRYVGLVLLFSTETGEPLAIFPDGVMQRMRVGAANGLGVKYLARQDATTVAILGSGWQAGAQLMAVCAVRDIATIRCFSPNAENRDAFARQMSEALGVEIIPVAQPEEAITGADIVMCATNSVDHIFFERWIEPGVHLSSIKIPEIEPNAVKRADRVAVHVHDTKPIHAATKGIVLPETGRRPRLGDRRCDRFFQAADLAGPDRRPRRRPQVRRRGHLLSQQYRARLSIRRRRRAALPQGQGKRRRPRSADRLVHGRRASVDGEPTPRRLRSPAGAPGRAVGQRSWVSGTTMCTDKPLRVNERCTSPFNCRSMTMPTSREPKPRRRGRRAGGPFFSTQSRINVMPRSVRLTDQLRSSCPWAATSCHA